MPCYVAFILNNINTDSIFYSDFYTTNKMVVYWQILPDELTENQKNTFI